MERVVVAYFVTSHGFGHAARTAAVAEALGRRADVDALIVTETPEWFFAQSLTVPWRRIEAATDVGLVQRGPLVEDVEATVGRLEAFWEGLAAAARRLAGEWRRDPPRMIVSDISPLGLAVATELGVPSALVENFTWDWIYDGYADQAPALKHFGERYAELAARASLRFQCEPECRPVRGGIAISPVAREARVERSRTRRALGIAAEDERPLVLFTMGGLGWGDAAPAARDDILVATLGGVSRLERSSDLIRLPDRCPVYPPDLVAASDAVVAKLGYSTVAECFRSGVPMGFVGRDRFRESAVLERFVLRNLSAIEVDSEDLVAGGRQSWVDELLRAPRRQAVGTNGAEEIARRLAEELGALL